MVCLHVYLAMVGWLENLRLVVKFIILWFILENVISLMFISYNYANLLNQELDST
jgi:hypothetical protein